MAPRAALVLALGLLAVAPARAASPVELTDVRVARRAGRVSVELRTSAPPRYRAELIDGPWRVVLDLEDALYRVATVPLAVDADPVRAIRGSQYRKGVAAPRAPARTPELQGIVLRDDGPVAYIVAPGATQARGYRVGEAVGGGVVEAIGARHVVLRTAAGPVELFLDVPKPRAPQ